VGSSAPARFDFADGTAIGDEGWVDDLDGRAVKLSRLRPGEQFVYEFDFGDSWEHLCTIGNARVDPRDEVGWVPPVPTAYSGWGNIPDQYGRRWDEDDGYGGTTGKDPHLRDLPPLRPWWGSVGRGEGGPR
jgi:hypothetical protein